MMVHAAIHLKGTVAYFSLDTSPEVLGVRLLCAQAKVNVHLLKVNRAAPKDHAKLAATAESFRTAGIFMDDVPALTIAELRAKCRWLKRWQGLDMVIVDNMQLVRGEIKMNIGRKGFYRTACELKALAVEFDIPVIALSRLNRSVEERGGDCEPRLCDLPGPGAIEEHADLVIFVYRDEIYNKDAEKGRAKIILAKQHNGPIGEVPITFFAEYGSFEEYSPHA
jgi:replicative DNA helicase